MVPRYLVALAAELSRPLDDVHSRAVVALHIQIASREAGRFAIIQIARDRERFQENLGHYHRAAQVEHDTSIVERRQRCSEPTEIAMARIADCGAIRSRVLMDDFGAKRGVHGAGNSESISR